MANGSSIIEFWGACRKVKAYYVVRKERFSDKDIHVEAMFKEVEAKTSARANTV